MSPILRDAAAVVALSCLCAVATAASDDRSAGTLAIINARLETVTQGMIESGTLLMSGGRIVALGTSVNVPRDARIIDAAGRTVTPGLIACSTNLAVAEINQIAETRDDAGGTRISAAFDVQYGVNAWSVQLPVARESGVTHAVISPLVGVAEAYDDQEEHAAMQGGGENAGAYTALFAGQAAMLRLDASPLPVMRAKIAMALDLGQAGAQHAGGSRAASIILAKAALVDARHYARNRAAHDRGATRTYGLPTFDLEALIPVVEGRTPLLIRVSRAADIRQALALAREQNVRVILEDAQEAWLVADEIAAAAVPVLIDPQDDLPRSFELLAARLDNAARLQRAGVTIAIKGSRNFNSLRPIRLNAGVAVAYGLTRDEALRAITLNPARIWGIADRAGSLEVGKDADVVMWSGDPLEALSYATNVIVGGIEQTAPSRRLRLQERYAHPDDGYPPAYH
jgi:imidazolonepropionase-like amidohydrolase